MRLVFFVSLILTVAPARAQIAAAVVASGNLGVLQLDENERGVFAVVAVNLGKPGGSLAPNGLSQDCGGFDIEATGAGVAGGCVLPQATGAGPGPAGATPGTERLRGEGGG